MQQQRNTGAFNRVASAASMTMLFIVIAWFDAHADGGAVQFQKAAGPFRITVFATPTTLRAGPVDISLMIQSRDNQEPVLDCQTMVQLRKEGVTSIRSEATHEAAQNKLLYAAHVKVPESGLWELEAAIKQGNASINITGEITVAPSAPVFLVYWRSLALPPLIISLFVMNQWLKRRNRQRR
jgi:hypothetical protein